MKVSINDFNQNIISMIKNPDNVYRTGDIRAIYDIIDDKLVVLIVKVGWRGDIYD